MERSEVGLKCLFLLGTVLAPAVALHAQAEPTVRYLPQRSFTVSVDVAPTSGYVFLGQNDQRRLLQLQAGYRHALVSSPYAQSSWEIDVQPLVLMTEPAAETSLTVAGSIVNSTSPVRVPRCDEGTTTFTVQTPNGPTPLVSTTRCSTVTDFGAGVEPLGQHVRFLPFSRVGPFVSANAGIIVFNRNIPSDFGRRFNYQFDGGVGLEFALTQRKLMSVEYRVHHISNAYTAPDNSGIDQQMVRLRYILGR